MECRECHNPLKVIHGGPKIVEDKLKMVHVWGCLNKECPLKMQEQNRTETEIEQFEG